MLEWLVTAPDWQLYCAMLTSAVIAILLLRSIIKNLPTYETPDTPEEIVRPTVWSAND